MIYLDNSNTTPLHPDVLSAMMPHLNDEFAHPLAQHRLGLNAQAVVERARRDIAAAIGATAKELIFTGGSTESNNLAIIGTAHRQTGRKHLIVSEIEPLSILASARHLEQDGYSVTRVPVDGQGYVRMDQYREAFSNDTFLVSISTANPDTGAVQHIGELAAVARGYGVLFHTDASHAVGKVGFNVADLDVDLATFNAHLIHGPKGIAALYARRNARPKPLMHGGGQNYSVRPGMENVPAIVGFAGAVQICFDGMPDRVSHIRRMTAALRDGLNAVEGFHLNGMPLDDRLPGSLSVRFDHIEGEGVMMHLSNRKIYVSANETCGAFRGRERSPLMAIGLTERQIRETVGFSLSGMNSLGEVETTVEKTAEVVALIRKMTAVIGR